MRAAHYAASEVQSRLAALAEEHARLLETWRKRQELFLQSHSFQVFLRDAEQRETWITTQEAFLSNEDVGVCVYMQHRVVVLYVYSQYRKSTSFLQQLHT